MAKRKPINPKKVLNDILPMPGLPPAAPTPPPAEAPSAPAAPEYKAPVNPGEKLYKIIENPPPRPSVNAFLDHWFAQRGGPAQFALELSKEFDAAEAGTLVRSQIVQLIVRSMKVADTKEGANDDLGMVSDADLERLLGELGNRLLGDAGGG